MQPAAGVNADPVACQLLYMHRCQIGLDGRVEAIDSHGWRVKADRRLLDNPASGSVAAAAASLSWGRRPSRLLLRVKRELLGKRSASESRAGPSAATCCRSGVAWALAGWWRDALEFADVPGSRDVYKLSELG